MKKYLAGFLAGIIIATSGIAVASQSIKVFVNRQEVKSDVPAQIIAGRTMLPVRAICDALGAEVKWDAATRTVYITNDGTEPGEQAPTPTNTGNSVTAPNSVTVTINSVQHSAGGEYEKPKSGNEYLIVNVTLKNNSKAKVSYNPLYFGAKDSKGNITNSGYASVNRDTALSYGDLAAGGEVTGSLLFEVPTGDNNIYLLYNYEILGDKDVSIKIPQ